MTSSTVDPQWPDGGAHPPGVGFVETPGSVHKKHECPPEAAAMFARLEELERSYEQRLVNQGQVIKNLSDARQALLEQVAAWREFGEGLSRDPRVPQDCQGMARALLDKEN